MYKLIMSNSNRSFGVVFSILFFILTLYFFYKSDQLNYYLLFIGILFFVASTFFPDFLKLLNKTWIFFGEILGKIISPLVMLAIYLMIIFPTKLILMLFQKEIIPLKINKKINSYWKIKENSFSNNMDSQF